jgi:error-prone DNA polymerase
MLTPCRSSSLPGAGRLRYAELHCRSNFSFLRGASHPEELAERAAELGYEALAITDRNTLAGVVRMHQAAKAHGIPLIVGAEITPADAPVIGLCATDRAAYGRLVRLITRGRLRTPKGQCEIRFQDLADLHEGLIGIIFPTPGAWRIAKDERGNHEVERHLGQYRELFGHRLYLGAEVCRGHDDAAYLAWLEDVARRTGAPMVAANNVHYHRPERRFLQDVLTCIREHCTLETAGQRLFANAERHLKTIDEIARLFHAYPRAVARTLEIAERCTFTLDELRYEYPHELCPPGCRHHEYLAELTWRGARERFPNSLPARVRQQIEHELRLIAELSYEPYFLTVWDIVRFARSRGILCQGRGSAANSAVCYCLGITAVDPDRIDVLFERFVSRERNEPPDIDVDFEHERREEVFEYIYKKYGRDRAGIVAEVITYRPRSAVRDVGKALGLSLDRVDLLAKKLEWWGHEPIPEDRLREAGLDPSDRTIRCLTKLVEQILRFPRHLSQHVGGFVITRGPLDELVPIENGAMPGRTFIEWDKNDIDALGILKVDCLALGMLTAIRKVFDILNGGWRHGENRTATVRERPAPTDRYTTPPNSPPSSLCPSVPLSLRPSVPLSLALHTIPPEDPSVYDMIGRADTVGVFQIESRAQMSMLPRLRPRTFYDLVIQVAIVRPGPIQGGMVHPYLRRRRGEEPVVYPTPEIENVLRKTLGVPLFQEQAMRLAVVAAGFTPGEADQLRRAMGAWRRPGLIENFRQRLIDGMRANGLPETFARRVFEQICGFGEYGFPESHAASFALLVYVSAWLKRYHPAAFAASILNSQPMGFYAPAQLVRDARQHGVEVRPVDVNFSSYDCKLEEKGQRDGGTKGRRDGGTEARGHKGAEGQGDDPASWGRDGPALRLGMRLVKGLSPANVAGIERARADGPFVSVSDLWRRSETSHGVLVRLAAADAFRSMRLNRRQALWQVLAIDEELPLFAGVETDEPEASLPALSLDEQVVHDYDAVGLSLTAHPIGLLRDELTRAGVVPAQRLPDFPSGQPVRVGGLVLVRQRPSTASGTMFVTLEDETGICNLIIHPNVYERDRRVGRSAIALIAQGRIERQGDVLHVQAHRLIDLSEHLHRLRVRSRDFY